MKLYEVNGTYGTGNTPCTVFVAEGIRGLWYVVEGAKVVNQTINEIGDGVNVEELSDIDCFTWSSPINSLEELEEAINS